MTSIQKALYEAKLIDKKKIDDYNRKKYLEQRKKAKKNGV